MNPLKDLLVLDFSESISGSYCSLRLADFGARVIKVEHLIGDKNRRFTFKNFVIDGDSVVFHALNRNKESFLANLNDSTDIKYVKYLIKEADIFIDNFKISDNKKNIFDYESINKINPKIVYGIVSGYGTNGQWNNRPSEDLLIQSISGITWLNGDKKQLPLPSALFLAESFAGSHLAQGILSAIFRRFRTGKGAKVEVSLLESIMDLQFEFFSTFLNDGHKQPTRSEVHNANAYLSAPYGIYPTKDSYIALAMGSIFDIAKVIHEDDLYKYKDEDSWFDKRDEIKSIIALALKKRTTKEWLEKFKEINYWCSPVYSWKELIEQEGFKSLDLLVDIRRPNSDKLITTRCPIRIGGKVVNNSKWAPKLGEDNKKIINEFHLDKRGGEL